MRLIYVPKAGFSGPGEGWPAADHEESGKELTKAKLRSGFYRSESQKEQKASDKAAMEAKKAANAKDEAITQSVIDEAESDAKQATDKATEVRRNLGREK